MQGGTHGTDDARLGRALRLARGALEHYGLANARLELLRHDFVQVFRVRTRWRGRRRGGYVLRLYGVPRGGAGGPKGGAYPGPGVGAALRSPGVLRSQLAWLSALRRDTGLLVPEPVPTIGGHLVGDVRVEGTPWRRSSTLVGWVPGEHKREDLREADARELGSFVARMHAHAERWPLPEGSELPRWDWHWPFGGSAPLWDRGPAFYSDGEMETFRTVARRVREDLERLGEGREVFGLVHRDPKLENLLFEGGRVGAIDFDMSGLGYYLTDLRVFRVSLERQIGDRTEVLWAAFLEGYEGVRPLPRDHERYLRTFGAMQKVAAVNRHLGLLGSEGGGRRPARVLRAAAAWLEEWSRRWGAHAVVGLHPLTGPLPEGLSYAAGVLVLR